MSVNMAFQFDFTNRIIFSRKEREAHQAENQPRMSKLIKRVSPPQEDANNVGANPDDGEMAAASNLAQEQDDDFLNFEPNDHVKSMCQVVGGFIFVVDAAQQLSRGTINLHIIKNILFSFPVFCSGILSNDDNT